MANFCTNCGTPVREEDAFCPNCGARLTASVPPPAQPVQAPLQQAGYPQPVPQYSGYGEVRLGIPMPGFSDRVNHPEILAAMKKSRKSARIAGFFLIPLPLIGFLIYASFSREMEMSEAAIIGGIVSFIFLLFSLFSARSSRESKGYEAVVVNQTSRKRSKVNGDERHWYTEYVTTVETTDGRQKRIVENSENGRAWAWDYLKTGDRFRCHPQFHFPYERYDKAAGKGIYCVSCQTRNPVEADRCTKCGLPLLK